MKLSSTTAVILTTGIPPRWFKHISIFENKIIIKLKNKTLFYPLLVEISSDWTTNDYAIYKRFNRQTGYTIKEWRKILLAEIMKYDKDLALDWFRQANHYKLKRAREILFQIFSDSSFSNSISISNVGTLITSKT